jgi:hypothetical protein
MREIKFNNVIHCGIAYSLGEIFSCSNADLVTREVECGKRLCENEHMTTGFNETKTLTLLFFKAAIKC